MIQIFYSATNNPLTSMQRVESKNVLSRRRASRVREGKGCCKKRGIRLRVESRLFQYVLSESGGDSGGCR